MPDNKSTNKLINKTCEYSYIHQTFKFEKSKQSELIRGETLDN